MDKCLEVGSLRLGMKSRFRVICRETFLVLILLQVGECQASDVYVSSFGRDFSKCGNDISRPCGTLQHAVDMNPKRIIMINTNSPFYINYPVVINTSISIIGRDYPTISSTLKPPDVLFTVKTQSSRLSLLLDNIRFFNCSAPVLDVAATSTHNSNLKSFNVTMRDVTIEEARGNAVKVTFDNEDGTNRPVLRVSIERCTFTRNKFYGHDGGLKFWAVQRVNLEVCVSNSRLVNNTLSGGGRWRDPSGVIKVGGRSGNYIRVVMTNNTFIRNVIGWDDSPLVFNVMESNKFICIINHSIFANNTGGYYGGSIYFVIAQHNNVTLNVDHSTFTNNIGGHGGSIYFYIAQHNNDVTLNVDHSIFTNNIGYVRGGSICFLIVQHNNYVTLNVDRAIFRNNQAGDGGALWIRNDVNNSFTCYIKDTIFLNNGAIGKGGVMYFYNYKENNIQLKIEGSKFCNNTATVGGTIFFEFFQKNIFTLNLFNSTFVNNNASLRGGVLYISESQYFRYNYTSLKYYTVKGHGNLITSIINKTVFSNNSARIGGGAIYLFSREEDKYTNMVESSNFYNNNAGDIGGAISLTNVICNIIKTNFTSNGGFRGGALFFEGIRKTDISSSTFFGQNIVESSTDITIIKTLFTGSGASDSIKKQLRIFVHRRGFLTTDSTFNISCPENHDVSEKSMYGYKLDSGGKQVIDTNKLSHLEVGCSQCSKGSYSIEKSVYWFNVSGGDKKNIKCNECPSGGSCQSGSLSSLNNYWGYRKDNIITFLPCPPGFCSKLPISYNSCANNRQGNLCSHCTYHYTVNLFSSECISNDVYCGRKMLLLVIPILLIPALMLIIVMFGENLKDKLKTVACVTTLFTLLQSFKTRLITVLQSFKTRYVTVQKACKRCTKCSGKEADAVGEDEDKTSSSDAVAENEKTTSMFSRCRLIWHFYQLQMFTKVASTSNKLQNVLSTIFHMNFIEGAENPYVPPVCLFQDFNNINKKAVNLFVWSYTLFLCLLVYVIICCVQKVSERFNQIDSKRFGSSCETVKRRLEKIFTQIALLSYIPLATTLCEMVHCVTISDVEVLFSQSDVVCYSWWQKGIIAIIVLWVVPFFLSIYAGITLLDEKRTKTFLMVLIVPFTSLYFVSKSIHQKWKNRERDDNESRTESVEQAETYMETDFGGEQAETDMETDFGGEQPGTSEDIVVTVDQRTTFIRENSEAFEKHVGELLEVMKGHCKVQYWPAVQILRHVLLVGIFVFVDHAIFRLYAIVILLMIFQIILVSKQPYQDRTMNWMDISLSSLLIIMAVLCIFDSVQIFVSQDDGDYQEFHRIVQFLKLPVLMLPPVLLGVYMLIEKLESKKNRSDEKKGK